MINPVSNKKSSRSVQVPHARRALRVAIRLLERVGEGASVYDQFFFDGIPSGNST